MKRSFTYTYIFIYIEISILSVIIKQVIAPLEHVALSIDLRFETVELNPSVSTNWQNINSMDLWVLPHNIYFIVWTHRFYPGTLMTRTKISLYTHCMSPVANTNQERDAFVLLEIMSPWPTTIAFEQVKSSTRNQNRRRKKGHIEKTPDDLHLAFGWTGLVNARSGLKKFLIDFATCVTLLPSV